MHFGVTDTPTSIIISPTQQAEQCTTLLQKFPANKSTYWLHQYQYILETANHILVSKLLCQYSAMVSSMVLQNNSVELGVTRMRAPCKHSSESYRRSVLTTTTHKYQKKIDSMVPNLKFALPSARQSPRFFLPILKSNQTSEQDTLREAASYISEAQ